MLEINLPLNNRELAKKLGEHICLSTTRSLFSNAATEENNIFVDATENDSGKVGDLLSTGCLPLSASTAETAESLSSPLPSSNPFLEKDAAKPFFNQRLLNLKDEFRIQESTINSIDSVEQLKILHRDVSLGYLEHLLAMGDGNGIGGKVNEDMRSMCTALHEEWNRFEKQIEKLYKE